MTRSSAAPSLAACDQYVQRDRARTQERLRDVLARARQRMAEALCPYCVSPVHPSATVCATCRRDLPDPAARSAARASIASEALAAWQAEAQRALIREELVVPTLVQRGGSVTEASARHAAFSTQQPFGEAQEIGRRHAALVAAHERDLLTMLAHAEQAPADGDVGERLLRIAPFPFRPYAAEVQRQRQAAWNEALAESCARTQIADLPPVPEHDHGAPSTPDDTISLGPDGWSSAANAAMAHARESATFQPVLEALLASAAKRYAGRVPDDARVLLSRMTPAPLASLGSVHRIPSSDLPSIGWMRIGLDVGAGPPVRVPWPSATRHAVVLTWAAAGLACLGIFLGPGLAATMLLVLFAGGCAGAALWMTGLADAVVDDRALRRAREVFHTHGQQVALGVRKRNAEWREAARAALAGRPVVIEQPSERLDVPAPTVAFAPSEPLPPAIPSWARFAVIGASVAVAAGVSLLASAHRADRAEEAEQLARLDEEARVEEARQASEAERSPEQARADEAREAAVTAALDAVADKGMNALQPALEACRTTRVTSVAEGPQPPFAGGRWAIRFIVLPTGRTSDVAITPLGQADPPLETCIGGILSNAAFPLIVRPVEVARELEFDASAEVSATSAPAEVGGGSAAAEREAPRPRGSVDPLPIVRALADGCGRRKPALEGSRWRVQFLLADGATPRNVRVSNILGDDEGLSTCLATALRSQTFNADPDTAFSTVLTGGAK